ncbi:hypothetical protein BGZ61DRAFT_498355 [Ilyonectria robusta]|uniref:uncharacterized protein n=1 Tax=Ilyonectria robusta TaxID=1079257 RepID=UPI001E8DD782|nr:uncharacterized protein BGZ61DRAFT_498355 [Ilyonectria robusta]KAH8667894.1 hypothetical protein BGZ61DRAFT_498355 [Ilyonectria robusta]
MTPSQPSSSALVLATPGQTLQDAINDFQGILTVDQRRELQAIKTVPDADAVLVFTAELDAKTSKRRGPSLASRVYSVLQSVRDFSTIVDTYVSSHPEIAALVWGSVRLTMLVVSNFVSYYDAVSDLFMDLGRLCPRFAEYQILYPNSARLQKSLSNFHASIVNCCKHVVEAARRPWSTKLLKALWESFEQEFKPDVAAIQRLSKDVRDELGLAKAQADRQDQKLQDIERKESAGSRWELNKFFKRADDKLDKLSGHLQRDERRARKRRQELLDSLSTHDYLTPLKLSRRKRHSETGKWLFQTPEFDRWINGTGSPILWYSGKIGSGKTILTASVIDHILTTKRASDVFVLFFFPRFDEMESLRAETILRSIVRQVLEPNDLSEQIETALGSMGQSSSTESEEVLELLQMGIAPLRTFYIIIDGLDECERNDRRDILQVLSSLISSSSKVKVFMASRENINREITKTFRVIEHISMGCPSGQSEIAAFVEDTLQERLETEDLVVGDPTLINDVKQALIEGAEGMFLWVIFQIDEICMQHCDDDIRNCIKDLPKDLTDTFNRCLSRISARGKAKLAQQTFPWIAAAKRPLCLDELREAILIEVGQPYSKPDRFINDIQSINSWCENLVEIDEEHKSFHFNLEEADHHLGEICVTYLNFNDFKTALARRHQPLPPITPVNMAWSTLPRRWRPTAAIPLLGKSSSQTKSEFATVTAIETLQLANPFLRYASIHWIFHTRNFEKESSKMWHTWKQMIIHGHALAVSPWGAERHYALIRLITTEGTVKQRKITSVSVREGDITMLNIALEVETSFYDLNDVLVQVTKLGYPDLVERLIQAGAEVNHLIRPHTRTALEVAADAGYLDIVEILLQAGADAGAHVNPGEGQSPLQAAAGCGHLDIVEVGADPNPGNRRSPLQAAAGCGHLDVVDRLLLAGAEVNLATDEQEGLSALEVASAGGHMDIVERLIAAGASRREKPVTNTKKSQVDWRR